jgi:hypothetical protein
MRVHARVAAASGLAYLLYSSTDSGWCCFTGTFAVPATALFTVKVLQEPMQAAGADGLRLFEVHARSRH